VKKNPEIEENQSKQTDETGNFCDKFSDDLAGMRAERRDAAENSQRILEAARQLFAEQSAEQVTMQQIAKAAGVGQGTLYRRYGNKGELCFALLRASFAHLRDEVEQSLAQLTDDTSPLAQLDDLLKRLVEFIENQMPLLEAMEVASIASKGRASFHNPLYQWTHQTTTYLLQEAIVRSEILPLDPVYTADALLATLNIDLYLFQRRDRGFTSEQILQGVRWIYIDQLRIT
jgi:AcrR family transcriptional regulator